MREEHRWGCHHNCHHDEETQRRQKRTRVRPANDEETEDGLEPQEPATITPFIAAEKEGLHITENRWIRYSTRPRTYLDLELLQRSSSEV
jgi:hypothetical protein